LLFRKPILRDKISSPLAPALPPSGAGAHMMFRNYLYRNFLVFLCKGNTALSHLGRLSGGAKPLERHVILYDFYRAKIFDDFFSHVEFVYPENALNPLCPSL
jgi:hypothetical protein